MTSHPLSGAQRALIESLGEREPLLDAVARAQRILEETAGLEPALFASGEDAPEWLKMLKRAGFA